MITQETRKRFFENRDETGRFKVVSLVTGVQYFVEPIGDGRMADWGSYNPSTGDIENKKGAGKYSGSVTEEESLITVENGFKCIGMFEGSGLDEITRRDKVYEEKGYRAKTV